MRRVATGTRDAAPHFSETQPHQTNENRTHHISEDRSRSEQRRHEGGQPKDPDPTIQLNEVKITPLTPSSL